MKLKLKLLEGRKKTKKEQELNVKGKFPGS